MGKVWKAHHHSGGQPAAIKVMRAELAGNQRYLEGFHQEVRSIARLDHPGIVQIYDHGIITDDMARRHSSLEPGGLWLAMEYADGGSLEETPPRLSWTDLRTLLLQILEALSHAHARSLVHRDLKPANVLCRPTDNEGEPDQWILSDFGIAHIRDPAISSHTGDINAAAAGTPLFMSPEQIQGHWRDYGPWTDLYALGCMAFLLSGGEPPFSAGSVMAIAVKHISDPVPKLKPVLDVPPGFENWMRRLMAKEIHRRYRRAANAASDLVLLGDPEPRDDNDSTYFQPGDSTADAQPTQTFTSLPESIAFRTRLLDDTVLSKALTEDQQPQATTETTRPNSSRQSPQRITLPPASWTTNRKLRRRSIPAAGKGIFGLRQPIYVGRKQARDRLWQEFHQVCSEQQTRHVVLRSKAGLGKSRLMHWLTRRTHELGLATNLTTQHSPIMTPADGLPKVIQAHLGATGLDRRGIYKRLKTAYATHFLDENPDPRHLAAVVEWISPRADDADDDGVPVITLESPQERYTLAEEVLSRFAQHRPLVLGIDDGHWAQETLGFVQHLLTHRSERPLPILIITTVRPASLTDRLMEQEYLELLTANEATSIIELAPLGDVDQRQLIKHLLGLEDSLVDRINSVAKGVPLFAVQLIEDWVSRDALEDSPEGYVLAKNTSIPADLDALLDQRIDDISNRWECPEEAQIAMEVAAALGIDVDRDEWHGVCQRLGINTDAGLLDHFMVHGIALPHSGGWRLRLPLYRDCLERISIRNNRWQRIHTVIAETIIAAGENGACLPERRARHLVAAENQAEAIPLLWQAVDFRMQRSAYVQSQALLSLLETVFDDLEFSPHHIERYRLQLRRAETFRFRGFIPEARKLLTDVFEAEEFLDDALRAEAHRLAANLANVIGDFEHSLQHYKQAHQIFDEIGDLRGVAQSLHGMGWVYTCLGRIENAHGVYKLGFEVVDGTEYKLQAAWCLAGMAESSMLLEISDGSEYARRALELFDSLGCRSGMAISHRSLGDQARFTGNMDLARRHYKSTRHLATMAGHVLSKFTSTLLAVCDLEEGDLDSAHQRFSQFNQHLVDGRLPVFESFGNVGLLAVAASRYDTESFDAIASKLTDNLSPRSPIKRDLINLLRRTVVALEAHDDPDRLAIAQDLLAIFTLD